MAIRRDLEVLEQDLAALSDEVAKLGNLPDDQSTREASNRIRRIRADLDKMASALDSESPGPIIEIADKVIEPVQNL